jgi:O-antigen ligase
LASVTTIPPEVPTLDPEAVVSWTTRWSAHLLGLGLALAVLAALPAAPSDLDRFQLPKELVMHGTVWAALLLARPRDWAWPSRAIRAALGLLVLVSIASASVALNAWLGWRGTMLTITASVAFLLAHHLGRDHGWRLVGWALAGATVAAATAAAQAWGLDSVLFAPRRAPGGTLGNRNFVGHIAALGLPAAVVLTVIAARWRAAVFATLAGALILALLILTRSRAAWLGAGAGLGTTALALVLAWRHGGLPIPRARLALLGAGAVLSGIVAFGVPNTLDWRSDSPYRDTLTGVANFQEGSGRGRLIQYRRTLGLAAEHPLLGVGPANWPIRYGEVAPPSDPSWAFGDDIPLNPWPSSDWIALASERGIPGVVAVLLLGMGLLWRGWRGIRSGGTRGAAGALLIGTVAAVVVVGGFDAVLLLPVPALLVALVAGGTLALTAGEVPPPTSSRRGWWLLAAIVVAVATARSAQQVAAYAIAGDGGSRSALRWAARVDPTSYPIRIRLARQGSCREARPHIAAVRRLAPNWPATVRVARRCR